MCFGIIGLVLPVSFLALQLRDVNLLELGGLIRLVLAVMLSNGNL